MQVLFFGKQTIQVWNFTSREPSLQYIWCKPMPAVNYSIDEPSLGRVKKGFILKFRCNFENSSDSKEQIIPLRPTRKFLEFKDHVAHQIGPSHGLHFNKLLKQCEGIVYSTIRSNTQIFNTDPWYTY